MVRQVKGKVFAIQVMALIRKKLVVLDVQTPVIIAHGIEELGQFGLMKDKFGIYPVKQPDLIQLG